MNKCLLLCCLFLLLGGPFLVHSQQGHAYKEYSRDICIYTERIYNRIPDEVYFQVQLIDNTFWVVFNDEEWFDDFFSGDGGNILYRNELALGVQLVGTDYFSCNRIGDSQFEDFFYNLPPVSYRALKRQQVLSEAGVFMIPLGELPPMFFHRAFDHGIIISKRDRACINHWYTKIPAHDWNLLEHALIMDTLVFATDSVLLPPDKQPISLDLRMDFDVLFPKNEIVFSRDSLHRFIYDIHPIHHNPLKISISAFASIEGPENRNKTLYEKRGEVIYNEIAPLFPPDIEYEIKVDENWDDFYSDIANGPFAYLQGESPETIRELIRDTDLSADLEPLLKNHRKATVSVFIKQTITPADASAKELVDFYVKTLKNQDLENTVRIQNAIFDRMQGEGLDVDFPDSLPMPATRDFSAIFIRDYIFRYRNDLVDTRQVHDLFLELQAIYPGDPHIGFNLAELSFRRWLSGDTLLSLDSVLRVINGLPDHDVPLTAVNRLMINYHLVSLLQSMANRDSRARVRSASAVQNLYGAAHLKEEELINLAQFFVAYRQNDRAERLLRPFARTTQPDEDLLFYFIALTITKSSSSNARWYKDLLYSAHKMNPKRFCDLFQPVSQTDAAGISLLFRENLKDFYCTYCEEPLYY